LTIQAELAITSATLYSFYLLAGEIPVILIIAMFISPALVDGKFEGLTFSLSVLITANMALIHNECLLTLT
jgi:hypothetical protein